MKILIKGDASVEGKAEEIKELDGVSCDECFSDYFTKSFTINGSVQENDQKLIDAKITGGYMRFEYIDDKLITITEYTCPRKLTEEEEKLLIEYTQGQWSDGIGEGFEQEEVTTYSNFFYISAWHYGQIATLEYKK